MAASEPWSSPYFAWSSRYAYSFVHHASQLVRNLEPLTPTQILLLALNESRPRSLPEGAGIIISAIFTDDGRRIHIFDGGAGLTGLGISGESRYPFAFINNNPLETRKAGTGRRVTALPKGLEQKIYSLSEVPVAVLGLGSEEFQVFINSLNLTVPISQEDIYKIYHNIKDFKSDSAKLGALIAI